jgi:hypothetical protein
LQARYEPLAIIEIYESIGLFYFSASVAIALASEPSSDFSVVSRSVVMFVLEILTRRCQVRHRSTASFRMRQGADRY